MDGDDYVYNYGRSSESPKIHRPEFLHGSCESYLDPNMDGTSTLPASSVDLIVDDPPYGITQSQWDNEPDWDKLTKLYHRVLADDGLLVIFGRQPSLFQVYNAFANDGFDFRFEIIWKKHHNMWSSNQKPIMIHENVHVYKKSQALASDTTFNIEDIMRDGDFRTYTSTRGESPNAHKDWESGYESKMGEKRYPISVVDQFMIEPVLEYQSVHGKHNEYIGYTGQKPTNLLRWLVMAMSDDSDPDIVLDPHAGSGSTLIAALQLGRKAIGIELAPERYQDAKGRIEIELSEFDGLTHAETISENTIGPLNRTHAVEKYS